MARKRKSGSIIAIAGLCIFFMIFTNSLNAQEYDISYTDISGDVVDSETGQGYPTGYEHIDMIQIDSEEFTTILDSQLVFQMLVSGTIMNSEEVTYSFFLLDYDDPVYVITYSNNIATGVNLEDGSLDILQASGTGTNTLEVSVQLSNVPDITDYDFGAATLHVIESQDRYLVDAAGSSNINPGGIDDLLAMEQMPVTITEPRFGATVSKIRRVKGITNSDFDMESVEIQMDSKSQGNWILTSTSDDWGNWSYDLDTTSLTAGKHRLHARAYNGSDYFEDTIEIFVDQDNADSPRTTALPKIFVGDNFHYRISADIPSLGGSVSYSSSGWMNLSVEKIEDIFSEGNEYETFKIRIEGIMVGEFEGSKSISTQSGFDWIRTSDLASVKSEITTITEVYDGEDTTTITSTITVEYDPPIDRYDFPIGIGRSWKKSGEIHYKYVDDNDVMEETFSGPFEFEALHVEDVTVGAGSFETFVLWTQDFYSDDNRIDCQLDYYSPELGFPAKSEMYDSHRNLYYTAELVSYEKMKEEDTDSGGLFGIGESQLPWIIIIIIVIVVILVVLVVIRRRGSSDDSVSDTKFEDLKAERPVVHTLGLSQVGREGAFRFAKCPRCSNLMSIERGTTTTKCPYCGLIQKV